MFLLTLNDVATRGRPRGTTVARIKTWKFDVGQGVQLLTDLACRSNHPQWNWDGKTYTVDREMLGPVLGSAEIGVRPGYICRGAGFCRAC